MSTDWKDKKVKVIEMKKDDFGKEVPTEVEVPVWEKVIGDAFALMYIKTYNEQSKKFSYYFDPEDCRIEDLKQKLLPLENGKEIEYDGHYFRKYIKDPKYPRVYKQTLEEHNEWKSSFKGGTSGKQSTKAAPKGKVIDYQMVPLQAGEGKNDMSSIKELLNMGYELFGDSQEEAIKVFGNYLLVGLVLRE